MENKRKTKQKHCENLLKICDENVFWYSTEEMFRGHFCGTAENKVLFSFHNVFIERDWKYGGYIWVFSFTKTMSKTLEKHEKTQRKHLENIQKTSDKKCCQRGRFWVGFFGHENRIFCSFQFSHVFTGVFVFSCENTKTLFSVFVTRKPRFREQLVLIP